MDKDIREEILVEGMCGQESVNSLFRHITDRLFTGLAAAHRDHAPTCGRERRAHLRDEGIVIVGHQKSAPDSRGIWVGPSEKGLRMPVRITEVDETDERTRSKHPAVSVPAATLSLPGW